MSAPTDAAPDPHSHTSLTARACHLLAGMAAGSLRDGQMPPKSVFDWFVDFTTAGVIEREKASMAGETGPDHAAEFERYVVTLSELLRICDANHLLVTKDRALAALNARRLYLPADFDYTYGGLLDG